jgi:hypothetical protein
MIFSFSILLIVSSCTAIPVFTDSLNYWDALKWDFPNDALFPVELPVETRSSSPQLQPLFYGNSSDSLQIPAYPPLKKSKKAKKGASAAPGFKKGKKGPVTEVRINVSNIIKG